VDHVKALQWNEAAAALGHRSAQFNAGVQRMRGLGCDQVERRRGGAAIL